MRRHICHLLILVGVLVMPLASATSSETEARGAAIAADVYARERGFGNYRMDMEMILRDRNGQETTRKMQGATLEVNGDGDKHLIVFMAPADIKHTAFLSFSHADTPDEQWLYLPALKRTRRIASESKSGSFLGSEFSFEDLTSQLPQKFSHTYAGDDTLAGQPTYKLLRLPRYEGSGYTRQVLWIDKARLVVLKTEFYDRRDTLQKTLESGDYDIYDGGQLRPGWMTMHNHQTGKSTRINMTGYRFRDPGIGAQSFLPQRLEYAR